MDTDTLKTVRRYFKTSGLAKPLSLTARPLLPTPHPTALPGRLPTAGRRLRQPAGCRLHQPAGCRLQPEATSTRHRRDGHTLDETTVQRRYHLKCICPWALFYKVHQGQRDMHIMYMGMVPHAHLPPMPLSSLGSKLPPCLYKARIHPSIHGLTHTHGHKPWPYMAGH